MSDREAQRLAEYEICKRRGHQPTDHMLPTNPPQNVCRWCGAWYRHDTQLIERNVPAVGETEGEG